MALPQSTHSNGKKGTATMATMEQSLGLHAIAVRGVRCPLCESTNIRSSRYLDTDGPVRRSVLAAHRCWRCGTRLYSVKRPVRHALTAAAVLILGVSFSLWQSYAEAAATVRPEGRAAAELYARADATDRAARRSTAETSLRLARSAQPVQMDDGSSPQWTGMRHALRTRAATTQPASAEEAQLARVGDPLHR